MALLATRLSAVYVAGQAQPVRKPQQARICGATEKDLVVGGVAPQLPDEFNEFAGMVVRIMCLKATDTRANSTNSGTIRNAGSE